MGVAIFMLLHNLGAAPLVQHDEGTYAAVVGESLARGDFVTFTYQGEEFFDKPPLYFWLAGLATYATGDAVLGIRLPAALAGIAVVALTMLLAHYYSRSTFAAAAAGAVLLSIAPFVAAAREARLDVLITVFILLALYCVLTRRWRWWGAMLGLAVLSKSVIAAFAVAPALPQLRRREFWEGAAVAAAVALPWHLAETARHGGEFWRSYVGFHVVERYATNVFGDPGLQTAYLPRLAEQARAPLALFFLSLGILAALRTMYGMPLAMLALMAAVFFTAETRALPYLVPMYPFAAIIIALAGFSAIERIKEKNMPYI